jgi:signal transduction histidine kinase
MDEMLEGVSIGIYRLRQIIDDMIDVSLIDNQMLALNLQPLQLSQLFDRLRTDFQETIRDRNQTLEIKDFDGGKTWLYADPDRVHQALKNIILNAVKFTPDGGRITVDGRVLPGFLEVIVTDSGIGISIEDQSLIFEKFGQLGRAELHSSGKTKFKGGGPGLGLAIARGIVEAHGGSIWVESTGYDEKALPGSRFHILLPSRTEPNDARVAKLFDSLEATNAELYGKKETRTDRPPT